MPGPAGWRHRSGVLELDGPRVMGVLNVTPDSFSDGGRYRDLSSALEHALRLVDEGAAIIDVGGESTRPGALPIDPEEESRRVVPVIRALRDHLSIPISIDTRRSAVARAALEAGADIVNDISALRDPAMAEVVASTGAGLVLMHMRGTPQTMQHDLHYEDVVAEVVASLSDRVVSARAAGVAAESIVVDPGIGFAKSFDQNLELIAHLDLLHAIGRPILLGASRKAFLGAVLGGVAADARDTATAAACVVGFMKGASIFRVHDVRSTREALQVADAIRRATRVPA